jgi:hypothetical protein
MVVVEFGSLTGHWIAFLLFGAIAALCGYAVSRIAGQFAALPGETPYFGTTPRARRIIGAAVTGLLLTVVWFWLWSGFHRLEVTSDTVTLGYHVPPRSRVVPTKQIERLDWRSGPRSTRLLVITTTDGRTLQSMQTTRGDADRALLESLRRAVGR